MYTSLAYVTLFSAVIAGGGHGASGDHLHHEDHGPPVLKSGEPVNRQEWMDEIYDAVPKCGDEAKAAVKAMKNVTPEEKLARKMAIGQLKTVNGNLNAALPQMMLTKKSRADHIKKICKK